MKRARGRRNPRSKGAKIIPQQDFVKANGILTVFGIGGPYATERRDVVVAIFFTKESLPRDVVQRFERMVEKFKSVTVGLVKSNKIFAS